MTRQIISLLIISCSTWQISQVSAEQVSWQQADYIVNSFLNVALKNEHGKSDGRLHKWREPIRYHISDRTGDQALHQKLTTIQLAHLSAITGQVITPATSSSRANLTIIFSSETKLGDELNRDLGLTSPKLQQDIQRNSVCVARFGQDKLGAITRAVVIIPVDRARAHGKLLACVVEELTQILGLPNDSTDVYPSIFNDRSFNDFLTGLDYVLLKLLYAPELKPGMDRKTVASKLRQLLAQQNYAEMIATAEFEVRKQSIENLLE